MAQQDNSSHQWRMLPLEMVGRDERSYIVEPKTALPELFACKTKEVYVYRDKATGKKVHVEHPEAIRKKANFWQFFTNLASYSLNKTEGAVGEDARDFKPPSERWYTLDFDQPVNIAELPYFMRERGMYTLSSSKKLHWHFRCHEDLRPFLGNRVAMHIGVDGKIFDDIDLKDQVYESMSGFAFFPSATKEVFVSSSCVKSLLIGAPKQLKADAQEMALFADHDGIDKDDTKNTDELWRALLQICAPDNQHHDTWRRMAFVLPKEKCDLFVWWSGLEYKACEAECRRVFESSDHLRAAVGLEVLGRTAMTHDAMRAGQLMAELRTSQREKYIGGRHRDMAALFNRKTRDQFAYTEFGGWYEIRADGTPRPLPDGVPITAISQTCERLVHKMAKDILEDLDGDDDETKKKRDSITKSYKQLVQNLGSAPYCANVQKFLQDMFKRTEVFAPDAPAFDEDGTRTLNMFTGFRAEQLIRKHKYEYNQEEIEQILAHINLLCQGNPGGADYVTKWLAQIVQQPWRKTGIALVLIGQQGIGKNLFLDVIRAMLGEAYAWETSDMERVFGRFNSALKHRFIVGLEEVQLCDIVKHLSRLKAYVTSHSDNIEHKGKNTQVVRSYARYILTSNESNPIKVDYDNRRFCIIESKAERQPKEYYDTLYKMLGDERVVCSLYQYLKQLDISGYDWIENMPKTEFVRELKEYSLSLQISFMADLYENWGEHMDAHGRISSDDLFAAFMSWCTKVNINEKAMTQKKAIMEIKRHKDKLGIEELRYRQGEKQVRGFAINKDQLATGLRSLGASV